jgi:hypothetical protein
MLKPIAVATFVAGTLDILSAFVFAGMAGMAPLAVLAFVARGPFGGAPTPTAGWAIAGLLVHYAIMACMAAAFLIAARRRPALTRQPIVAGLLYGLLLWGIMYWIVRPLRWPELPLPHTLKGIAEQLFSHCILVGLPIALVARRFGAQTL